MSVRLGMRVVRAIGACELSHDPSISVDEARRTGSCASCGPGDAFGWYCTEKSGSSVCARPSTVWSFRLTCVSSRDAVERVDVDGEAVVLRGDLDLAAWSGPSPAGCRRGGRT